MRILMIEDEMAIAEAVAEVLKRHHYLTDLAFDGEQGLDCALSGVYDAVILDIMLPRRDGISVLREMRENNIHTPTILLTAKGQMEDKIKGLDSGADDYMTKPFHTEELLARLRALERRPETFCPQGLLTVGDLTLDPHTLTLACSTSGEQTILSPKESQILEVLMRRGRMVSSKELLIEKVWGYDSDADDNHVEIQISLIRKKLAALRCRVKLRTVRGSGYFLEEGKGEGVC